MELDSDRDDIGLTGFVAVDGVWFGVVPGAWQRVADIAFGVDIVVIAGDEGADSGMVVEVFGHGFPSCSAGHSKMHITHAVFVDDVTVIFSDLENPHGCSLLLSALFEQKC